MDEIETSRIVPILDEFHLAPNKESLIKELLEYGHQVLIVDDIFSLNIKSENLIKSYVHFKINEFIPSLRNQLIKKWITLTDKVNNVSNKINDLYQSLDNKTELINSVLGKAIGSGIMPSYPFFILTIISTYETFEKPLENEITSQGYCYQTLICLYLGKQGVKGDNLDIYINYLTEFAFFFYTEKKNEISTEDYNSFIKLYSSKFNLHIKGEILLDKLLKTNIILLDSCNNYSFRYQYLYYFFVARYLAENVDTNKAEIDKIINNLHNDENAYIAIFISHHSKHTYVIDQIVNNANNLFKNHLPATLNKKELHFFDGQADTIVKAILPPSNETPEQVRAKRLARQDFEEASKNKNDKKSNINFDDEEFSLELRRSVKTVEVMGLIIKNRAGSLEKAKLESIFEKAMKVHFRILTSFFEIIKLEKNQQEIVEYISTRLNKIIEKTAQERINEGKKARSISKEELEKFSKKIFWNTNFFVIYGFINKVVHSLGSDKLIEIVKKVCDDENTPASFLVKHGILMWYKKNLQTDTIAEEISKDNFSYIANRLIEFMVVNHCSIHPQGYKEKQKIELKLKIPSKKLLIEQRIAKEDK